MIGAVRQTLRRSSSRCRGYYQQIASQQILQGSKPCARIPVPVAAENGRVVRPSEFLRRSFATSAAEAIETPAPAVKNFVGGELVESHASQHIDVINPATQVVVSRVPLTTHQEFESAVAVAKEAFKTWKNTPVTARQRVMLKLQELIRRDMDKLALSITTEQGKTLADARGDVFRGLEVKSISRTNSLPYNHNLAVLTIHTLYL